MTDYFRCTPEKRRFRNTADLHPIIGDQTVVAAGIEMDLTAFGPASRITGATTYQRSVNIAKNSSEETSASSDTPVAS